MELHMKIEHFELLNYHIKAYETSKPVKKNNQNKYNFSF